MQQIQYYKSAWGDIKNSPGWFGKLCLLALLNFIPIFGQIVTYGYLYGWAREIAWGTHEPMPARIFSNEDGKLYRRGWFILVLSIVVGIIAGIVMGIGQGMQGFGFFGIARGTRAIGSSLLSGLGLLVYLIGLAGGLFLGILAWIGDMRISIYDRLSAGFQIGKIWKMFRYDTGGIMRIFGMNLLFSFIIGVILFLVCTIFLFLVILAGVAGLAAKGYNVSSIQYMSDAQITGMTVQFFMSAGVVGVLGAIAVTFISLVAALFVMTLVARAMGYWTMQFDVPHWRGQDDPMPFEMFDMAKGARVPQPVQQYDPNEPAQPASQFDPYAVAEQPVQPMQPAQGVQSAPPIDSAQQPPIGAVGAVPIAVAGGVDAALSSEAAEAPFEAEAAIAPEAEVAPDAAPEPAPESGPAPGPASDAVADTGQMPGFTYGGAAAPAPMGPVTESGADPSAATIPDLLVVIPEAEAPSLPEDEPAIPESEATAQAFQEGTPIIEEPASGSDASSSAPEEPAPSTDALSPAP